MSILGSVNRARRPWERTFVLGLVALLSGLVPLAAASPPDPTWIAGIYDDADLDEAVAAVTNADALVEHGPLRPDRAIPIVRDGVLTLDVPANALSAHSLGISVRAPPALFALA